MNAAVDSFDNFGGTTIWKRGDPAPPATKPTGDEAARAWKVEPFAAAEAQKKAAQQSAKVKRAASRTFDQIIEQPLIEVYPGVLWAGKYSVVGGDPGLGKSVIECFIAAQLTRGGKVSPYSDHVFEPRDVVLCSSEDDPEDTIKPRLRTAGADMKRVHDLAGMFNAEGNFEHLNLGAHLDGLDEYLGSIKPAALILDPITSFFGMIDSDSTTQVRGTIDPVVRILRRHGTALLGIMHLNKNERVSAIYRIGGSISMVGAPRAAFGFLRDKATGDKADRLLLPIKVNLQQEEAGFKLRIIDKGGHPFADWKQERCDIPIDELIKAQQAPSKTDLAKELLSEVLIPGDEEGVRASDLERMCRERGYGREVRRAALKSLGAKASRVGGTGEDGYWIWSIPADGVREGMPGEWEAAGLAAQMRAPLDAEISKSDWINT